MLPITRITREYKNKCSSNEHDRVEYCLHEALASRKIIRDKTSQDTAVNQPSCSCLGPFFVLDFFFFVWPPTSVDLADSFDCPSWFIPLVLFSSLASSSVLCKHFSSWSLFAGTSSPSEFEPFSVAFAAPVTFAITPWRTSASAPKSIESHSTFKWMWCWGDYTQDLLTVKLMSYRLCATLDANAEYRAIRTLYSRSVQSTPWRSLLSTARAKQHQITHCKKTVMKNVINVMPPMRIEQVMQNDTAHQWAITKRVGDWIGISTAKALGIVCDPQPPLRYKVSLCATSRFAPTKNFDTTQLCMNAFHFIKRWSPGREGNCSQSSVIWRDIKRRRNKR